MSTLAFDHSNLGVFESSNYYPGARTQAGQTLYLQSFPTHNYLRVNAFDLAVVTSDSCAPTADFSNCVAAFGKALQGSAAYLNDLLANTRVKVLVVDIFRTPTWLSMHPDSTPACGGGTLGQSYRPKDYTVWQQLLATTVTFMKGYENAANGPKIYYQFWNEPDLACNWQEGTPELLQLYSQTMPYIKSQHPTASVGGANLEYWNGKVQADAASRPQNLNFDLLQFALQQGYPLDFVSFHYFSSSYQNRFLTGMSQYRSFLAGLGGSAAQAQIYLSEWLPQDAAPNGYNPQQAADAANLFVAMQQAGLSAQGGVPWQDYGPDPTDEWGLITYSDTTRKPIYYVYEFFDGVSRSSLGLNTWENDLTMEVAGSTLQPVFKLGESRYVISQEPGGCYKMAAWTRIASASAASVAFLLGEGITLSELQAAYGSDPSTLESNLTAAVLANNPANPAWATAFQNAKLIYNTVDDINQSREYGFSFTFSGFTGFESITAHSYARDGVYVQNKAIQSATPNNMSFTLRPAEVLIADYCLQ